MSRKKTELNRMAAAHKRAKVRLVRRSEEHPHVIEVRTPGWRGVDHAFEGTIKQTMPADLQEICDLLKQANVALILALEGVTLPGENASFRGRTDHL